MPDICNITDKEPKSPVNGKNKKAVEIVHKPGKWVLTFERRFGILTKSSRETRKTNGLRQKSRWNLLTRRASCDNIKKLLNGSETVGSPVKNLKKVLDKGGPMC